MGADFWIVLHWWGTLFLVGAIAFPFAKKLFPTWLDRGYLFAKAVGMATVTYLVYLFAIFHWIPFTQFSIALSLGIVFVLGLWANVSSSRKETPKKFTHKAWIQKVTVIALEELFFFAALLFWSWVKGHEPSIHGLEKFMDYGFAKSILNSSWFPAPDMWYAGSSINYYYFGHTVLAMLTKLSGIDLSYTYNLMLASIFAFTFTMSFAIGKKLIGDIKGIGVIGKIGGGLLTAWLVTLAGNMQTLYAFTRGYTGDAVQPFWHLFWPIGEFIIKLPEGLERYWYANATRFIPFSIHEFPSYSFVVSDVHGHVLSLPFVLLAIALLINMFVTRDKKQETREYISLVFYGLLVAILLMTNALDGPIYLGLFIVLFFITQRINWKKIGLVIGVAALASLPFLAHFHSFVSGVAVNCPPAMLAGRKIGILLFEGVEKCQHSPLWMMTLLWGFFWYCGAALVLHALKEHRAKRKDRSVWLSMTRLWSTGFTQEERFLVVFFFFSIALLIFPEFLYFKDIYPAHFRSNTMFKLGYDAFILFSTISGYVIVKAIREKRRIFLLFLIPQLFLVSIYPIFSVRSYFDSLRTYKGLDGLTWMRDQYPDDYQAVMWLNGNAPKSSVIVEADGDSYTDYERFSAFTGFPTIAGWSVHEWLWRGTYDIVAPRKAEVQTIYESSNIDETREVLMKYGVSYVIVGSSEREKYPNLIEEKFGEIGERVFVSGTTSIYRVQ